MTQDELERHALWTSLCNHGDYIKLNIQFDEQKIVDGIQPYSEHWVPYNSKKDVVNNRWGLPITSHSGLVSDNMHLNSFGYMKEQMGIELKEENFNTFTEVYHNCEEIKKMVDIFAPDIGRVHMLRVDQGGFFPPHRDFKGIAPEYFRLTCVLGSCTDFNYVLNLDDKQFRHERGHLYFVNYQKNHNLFSFSNNLYIMILTVKLNQRTHDLIVHHAMSR